MKIVAVTSCPTGIAHTYMAAESLEQKAKEMNIEIKVETNGSIGVENELSLEEIKEADAVIIAADNKVEMKRFNGKKLIEVSVGKAIKEPNELLKAALDGTFEVYDHKEDY